jgi:cytochrome c biogenesis protein CcdA
VLPVIEELEKNPSLDIHVFEVYNNRENMVLLSDYFDAYQIPSNQRGVPVVFIGNNYYIGDLPILENLETQIAEYSETGLGCPSLSETLPTGETGESDPTNTIETLSLLTVIGAALVDSINPCAIAVLLILLGTLLAIGNKKRALLAGIAFTISIYIVYFLFGLGLFSAIQISGLSYWFYKVIGFLAILIGLFNLKDFFWYGGGGFVMEIPRRWRPTLKKLLNSVTSPMGAFFMGFVVCLFELPCTGGPYIFILGLLAEKTTRLAAIPILLLYNLFFVLPLIILTILIFVGLTNIDKATQWKDRNIRILHLIAGLLMLSLGILVVMGWI